MTNDQITIAITQIVSAQIETANHGDEEIPFIYGDVSLSNLGLDELDAVEILTNIEEAFGLELHDDDITLSSTVDGIAKLVAWHLRNEEHRGAIGSMVKDAWNG